MKSFKMILLVFSVISFSLLADSNGLVIVESNMSVSEVSQKLQSIIAEKGLNLFSVIDHSKNAGNVGKKLRPTQVIIFGNPNIGTLFMQKSSTVAIDLPQKFLIVEREPGKANIVYNSPEYLGERHGFDHAALKKVTNLLSKLSTAAAGNN